MLSRHLHARPELIAAVDRQSDIITGELRDNGGLASVRSAYSPGPIATSMTSPAPPALLLGRPYLASDAAEVGGDRQVGAALAAWRQSMAGGPQAAADATAGIWGDFAVGLNDEQHRCTFIAVDRFSARTLCYRVHDGRLLFSERADSLADVDAELDPQAVFDYLVFHCIPAPRTIFKGVFRLPPGHCAWFQEGHLTVIPYWVPRFDAPPGKASLAALKDEFVRRVEHAVARQLDGSTPACFLSGGTDSSTVAGMIGRVSGQPAHTFSIGFEAEGYDEMAFARIAAAQFGTVHHEYYVTPDDLVRGIPRVAAHYDQPFGNSSALPAFYCAKMARNNGITRMLAGDGGDELFGGNSRYAKQRVFGWYGIVPPLLRKRLLQPLIEGTALGALPGLAKARSYIQQAKAPMPDRLQMYNLLMRLGIVEVLTPEFLGSIDVEAPMRLQRQIWSQAVASEDLNRHLAFDWRFTLADSDLPKVRGTADLAGVGVGFPFLDDALLNFSTRLPADYKLKGLKLRWFFKEALRGFLPDQIITKKKQGFGLPFGVWATRNASLKDLAEESLERLGARGIVKPTFVRTLIEQRLPEHPGYYGEMVWILMMLEQWLEAHAPSQRFGRA